MNLNKKISLLCGILLVMSLAIPAHAEKIKYTYDDAGRLTGVDYGNGKNTTFVYDANGNRTRKTTSVSVVAEVALNMTPGLSIISVGALFTNRIEIVNSGPDNATGVTFFENIPFGVVLGLVLFNQGSCTVTGRTLRCDLGVLPAGSTTTLESIFLPAIVGTFTNDGLAAASEADGVMGNNMSSTVFTAIGVATDTDGDGMPDWWENLMGLDPNDPIGDEGGAGDKDKDRVSNLDEYLHDTDPLNANSFFTIDLVKTNATDTTVVFSSSPIRTYDGFSRTNLVSGDWTSFASNFFGTGFQAKLADTNRSGQLIYRVRSRIP